MNVIEELEKRIKSLNSHIEQSKNQIVEDDSGVKKLSMIVRASAELSIEKNTFLLGKYQQKLRKLLSKDINSVLEEEKTKKEIQERNYFKYQAQRIKRDKTRTPREIENALIIIDELPQGFKLEDIDIFEIGHKSRELFLELHSDLDDDLLEIKNEFLELIESHFNNENVELRLLNYRIPILILQLRVLLSNIRENIKDDNLKDFKGLPKFQDWWIQELWTSHQAYMGFFRWKQIILNLFVTSEQKKSFEMVFKNWLLVKKILNIKGETAYVYNNAFDQMIHKYAELEEETNESNLESLQSIVTKITKKENFLTVSEHHNIITPYMQFKIEKEKEKLSKEKKD
ncbi:MAG: hypothetical protein WBG69_04165 [Arcobacteraceae bacterium]